MSDISNRGIAKSAEYEEGFVAGLKQAQFLLKARAAAVPAPAWKILPDEQAWWWHWNGENVAIPHICSVMVSKTGQDRYFVADGANAPWCDELGGFWLKVGYPNVPARDEQKRLRAGATAPPKEG